MIWTAVQGQVRSGRHHMRSARCSASHSHFSTRVNSEHSFTSPAFGLMAALPRYIHATCLVESTQWPPSRRLQSRSSRATSTRRYGKGTSRPTGKVTDTCLCSPLPFSTSPPKSGARSADWSSTTPRRSDPRTQAARTFAHAGSGHHPSSQPSLKSAGSCVKSCCLTTTPRRSPSL